MDSNDALVIYLKYRVLIKLRYQVRSGHMTLFFICRSRKDFILLLEILNLSIKL